MVLVCGVWCWYFDCVALMCWIDLVLCIGLVEVSGWVCFLCLLTLVLIVWFCDCSWWFVVGFVVWCVAGVW